MTGNIREGGKIRKVKKRPTPFIACVTPELHRGRFCICGAGPVEHRQRFAIFVDCGGWRPLCTACATTSAGELTTLLNSYHRSWSRSRKINLAEVHAEALSEQPADTTVFEQARVEPCIPTVEEM